MVGFFLCTIGSSPERLRPGDIRQSLSERAAASFASVAQALRERGHEPQTVAHFVNRRSIAASLTASRIRPWSRPAPPRERSSGNAAWSSRSSYSAPDAGNLPPLPQRSQRGDGHVRPLQAHETREPRPPERARGQDVPARAPRGEDLRPMPDSRPPSPIRDCTAADPPRGTGDTAPQAGLDQPGPEPATPGREAPDRRLRTGTGILTRDASTSRLIRPSAGCVCAQEIAAHTRPRNTNLPDRTAEDSHRRATDKVRFEGGAIRHALLRAGCSGVSRSLSLQRGAPRRAADLIGYAGDRQRIDTRRLQRLRFPVFVWFTD